MIITALILGIAGSFHCLGMCSPLAMAVTHSSPNIVIPRLLYNMGRISAYGVLGALVASVGLMTPFFKFQHILSALFGIGLLIAGITGLPLVRIPVVTKQAGKFSLFLKRLFSKFITKKSYPSFLLLGSLNGFLPCGLTLMALTYCLTLPGPADGFIFMILFGLGTFPVMLGFTTLLRWITARFDLSMKKITTAMLILSGILLVARVFVVHFPESGIIRQGVDVLCR